MELFDCTHSASCQKFLKIAIVKMRHNKRFLSCLYQYHFFLVLLHHGSKSFFWWLMFLHIAVTNLPHISFLFMYNWWHSKVSDIISLLRNVGYTCDLLYLCTHRLTLCNGHIITKVTSRRQVSWKVDALMDWFIPNVRLSFCLIFA